VASSLFYVGRSDAMSRQVALAMSILILSTEYCSGQTTKSLLSQCREVVAHEKAPSPFPPDKVLGATACTNYIYGFTGGYLVTLELVGAKGQICFPGSATPVQLATAYVNWADRNPEKMQLPARSTILRAFQEAFPCTTDRGK
jgi:hypothetical protein